jgi:hypothetical protein
MNTDKLGVIRVHLCASVVKPSARLARRGQRVFDGFADETRVGNAARRGASLHRVQQGGRQPHVELRGLLLELEPRRAELGTIQVGKVLVEEPLRRGVTPEFRSLALHKL